MAQFKIFRSSDAGAPVLNGTAGSLTALLDACLVNGYGSKAAAGWTKEFSGTNKAAYRPGAGTRFYLRVQDDAPHATALGREARVTSYETMTDVDTGTRNIVPFNSYTQNYFLWMKSATADAVAREWMLVADERTMYFFAEHILYPNPPARRSMMFGDFYSYRTGDAYNNILIGRESENDTGVYNGSYGCCLEALPGCNSNPVRGGCVITRGWTGVGAPVRYGQSVASGMYKASNQMGPYTLYGQPASYHWNVAGGNIAYPSAGSVILAPLQIIENGIMRGKYRGLYIFLHDYQYLNDGTVFNVGGKQFLSVGLVGSWHTTPYTMQCYVIVEISDTLDTN